MEASKVKKYIACFKRTENFLSNFLSFKEICSKPKFDVTIKDRISKIEELPENIEILLAF